MTKPGPNWDHMSDTEWVVGDFKFHTPFTERTALSTTTSFTIVQ